MYNATWRGSNRFWWTSQSEQCHKKCPPEAHHGGLTRVFPPINAPSKQKHTVRRTMSKPWDLLFKRFAAWLMELNDYLPIFPELSDTNKIPPKEINKIILHAVPHGWAKQYYLQGWYFKGETYKETCDTFGLMEISDQVYKGWIPSKTTIRADYNHTFMA